MAMRRDCKMRAEAPLLLNHLILKLIFNFKLLNYKMDYSSLKTRKKSMFLPQMLRNNYHFVEENGEFSFLFVGV